MPLSEHDLNILVYIIDMWTLDNEKHRLYDQVEALRDRLVACGEVIIVD